MKKSCITLLLTSIIFLIILGFILPQNSTHTEYLRIHVRANSNNECDQAVKLKVKDAIVEYLVPVLSNCDTKLKAQKAVEDNLSDIVIVAKETLEKEGYFYGAKAGIKNEEFPTRVYNGLTLSSGYYDALIIELGSGEGDNWWCVVYPPLCFTGTGEIEYKSKIYQIVKNFYETRQKEEK